jgi:hypothetical protein
MVTLVENENLGLMLEPTEGGRVDDTVAVAAKGAAAFARRLGMQPATAQFRIARIARTRCRSFHHPTWPSSAWPIDLAN